MNLKTFSKYYTKLSKQIHRHPYKDELLNIMSQQLLDDTVVIEPIVITKGSA